VQERTGHYGNPAIAGFFEKARLFFKTLWHYKDIFEKLRLFLINVKISRLFKNIFSDIEAFLK
jgi:hypothetical protein